MDYCYDKLMPEKARLERPDLFKKFKFQTLASRLERRLLEHGQKASQSLDYQPNIAVVIRTKNDLSDLRAWIEHIERARQDYKGRIDLIVVDTYSTDGSVELAKQS